MTPYRENAYPHSTQADATPGKRPLLFAGALMLLLAVILALLELDVGAKWIPGAALASSGAATAIGFPKRWPWAGPFAFLAALGLSSGAWALSPWDAAYFSVAVSALPLAIAVNVLAGRRAARDGEGEGEALSCVPTVRWQGVALAAAASTLTLYFHALKHGVAADASLDGPRRMALSVGWIALGTGLTLRGARHGRPVVWAGLTLVGLGYLKALLYDTIRTHGAWRIAILTAGGLLVLALGTRLKLPRQR